jgi:hypothetical protein
MRKALIDDCVMSIALTLTIFVRNPPDERSLEETLDISAAELAEALSDPTKSEQLMRRKGWTNEQLGSKAEMFSQYLTAAVSQFSRV